MRIGPEAQYEQAEGSSLHDWCNDTGNGIMGLLDYGLGRPLECDKFIISQFERFGVPLLDPLIETVAQIGYDSAAYHVDCYDPYCLLTYPLSDVMFSNDWCQNTYEIIDPSGKPPVEANPDLLETYRLIPGQCEHVFQTLMGTPGLEALPNTIGMCIDEHIDNYLGPDFGELAEEPLFQLRQLCKGDANRMENYFRLSAWAAFVWIAGPLGRQLRYQYHDIFTSCLDHGEAILYEGTVITPQWYRKIARAPRSCYQCGIDSWCTELTHIAGTNRFICEHCLNGELEMGEGFCGTRACKYVQCEHNPYHSMGTAGIHEAMKAHGLMSGGTQIRLEQEERKLKLIAG